MLNDAVRLDSLPLKVVVAHDRLSMSQNSVVLAQKCALGTPNVSHVTLHFNSIVLRNIRPASSHDNLELQVANMLDSKVLFADNLTDESVRSARQDEVMFLAKESLQLVE